MHHRSRYSYLSVKTDHRNVGLKSQQVLATWVVIVSHHRFCPAQKCKTHTFPQPHLSILYISKTLYHHNTCAVHKFLPKRSSLCTKFVNTQTHLLINIILEVVGLFSFAFWNENILNVSKKVITKDLTVMPFPVELLPKRSITTQTCIVRQELYS